MNDGEPFVRVPVRLVRRLDDDGITLKQLGLAAALRYREWRDGGETTFTLAELREWLGYRRGSEQLRRELHELDYGELTAPPPGGRHWKWRSVPLKAPPEAPRDNGATPDEQGGKPPPEAPPEAPPAEPPLEVEVEVEVEVEPRAVTLEVDAEREPGERESPDLDREDEDHDPEWAPATPTPWAAPAHAEPEEHIPFLSDSSHPRDERPHEERAGVQWLEHRDGTWTRLDRHGRNAAQVRATAEQLTALAGEVVDLAARCARRGRARTRDSARRELRSPLRGAAAGAASHGWTRAALG